MGGEGELWLRDVRCRGGKGKLWLKGVHCGGTGELVAEGYAL